MLLWLSPSTTKSYAARRHYAKVLKPLARKISALKTCVSHQVLNKVPAH